MEEIWSSTVQQCQKLLPLSQLDRGRAALNLYFYVRILFGTKCICEFLYLQRDKTVGFCYEAMNAGQTT